MRRKFSLQIIQNLITFLWSSDTYSSATKIQWYSAKLFWFVFFFKSKLTWSYSYEANWICSAATFTIRNNQKIFILFFCVTQFDIGWILIFIHLLLNYLWAQWHRHLPCFLRQVLIDELREKQVLERQIRCDFWRTKIKPKQK